MGLRTNRHLSQIGVGARAKPGRAYRLRAAGQLRHGSPARAVLHPRRDPGAGVAAGSAGVVEMRASARFTDPDWPVRAALALILAWLGLIVWLVGGLALALVCLVPLASLLALSPTLIVFLPPLALACRSWPGRS